MLTFKKEPNQPTKSKWSNKYHDAANGSNLAPAKPPAYEVIKNIHLHLTGPCYIALGWVLIWVESWIGLRSFVNWVSSFPSSLINSQSCPAFCNWNCDKVFPLLNDWYPILRQDSIHRSRVTVLMKQMLYHQATMAGLKIVDWFRWISLW